MIVKSEKYEWAWKLGLGIIALVWMIPLIYMVSMSFRPAELAFEPVLFLPPVVDANYKLVLEQTTLVWNFLSSLIVTVSTVLLVALFASMATFGLTRKEIIHKKLIYNILMITLMVPISALVIPLAQINSRLGWINKYQGLILPYTALGIPFAIVVLKGFMDSFPEELEEAATVDGCGYWRLFFQVVLPILRPGMIVVLIWQFLTSWNEFFLALVTMSDVNMKTLTLVPMQYQGFYFSQPGALFAVLVIITFPMIVFYIAVQKYFVSGMMSGAIKG
jgi:raffinose/stachyose/melibiose transport system permease protein